MNTHLKFNGSEINYFDEENELVEFVDDEPVARSFADGKKLVEALFSQTDYASRYANTTDNIDVLVRVAKKLNRHNPRPDALTKSRLLEAYKVINAAGGAGGESGQLERLPEPAPASLRARSESGKFQNPLVAEYEAMLNTPSVPASAITARLASDRAFREAVEASRQPKATVREEVDPTELAELRKFATDYRRAPSIKYIAGYATIGTTQFTRAECDAKVERCAQMGLL